MTSKKVLCLTLLVLCAHTLVAAKPVASAAASAVHAVSSVSTATSAPLTFNLKDFGAVGDGVTDDGPALQSALDALAQAGGGTLFVPAGRYAIVTGVQKDFTGLAAAVSIVGVESLTPVPPPTASGSELTAGLGLVSEFAPRTGDHEIAINLFGLQSFLLKDITFIGTPGVTTDAFITLALSDIGQATIRHCEFYGLSSLIAGGSILQSVRSHFNLEQTVFLGCATNSGVNTSVVQNIGWKSITIADAIFVDYGQRPELYGKVNLAAPFSWVSIGNAAVPTSDSPRREAVIRSVFFDEGALNGLSSVPYHFLPASAPVDLIYVSEIFVNVANLGTSGNYIYGPERLLIENSHYGWSHHAGAAINLLNVGNAILDRVECVADANRILADAATAKLTVIDSVYTFLDSQASDTKVISTVNPEDDAVQYVRQQFAALLGREPDAAAHFYWSDKLLLCGESASCLGAERAALFAYLNTVPAPDFSISGTITDESGAVVPGVVVTLGGSQTVTTQTGGDGKYSFARLPTSGVYTVTPSHPSYTIAAQTIATPSGDQTTNFNATLNRYVVSVLVSDAAGIPLPGVAVSLDGPHPDLATTDSSGRVVFNALPSGGSYTITPAKQHYSFSPASAATGPLQSDQTVTFSAALVSYTLSGRVTVDGNGLAAAATVTLGGSQSATTTTDGHGNYSFSVFAEGSYTITPAKQNYSFSPASAATGPLQSDQTVTFSAALVSYTLSGRVTVDGNGLAAATVTLGGSQSDTATTDGHGNYSFSVLAAGSYTITPAKQNYSFSPASVATGPLQSDQSVSFSAALVSYTLSGRVTVDGNGLAAATVALGGSQSATTTTDADGSYSFSVLAAGSYTITPAKQNYSFSPASAATGPLQSDQTVTFSGSLVSYTLSGRVTVAGNGLAATTVSLSGSQSATTTTDANGNYSFSVLAEGSYTITPAKQNYSFSPASAATGPLQSDQSVTFSAALVSYTLSGRVTVDGNGLAATTVSLSGSQSAATTTDANGNYSFTALAAGSYILTPTKTNYVFLPANLTFDDLGGSRLGVFTGTLNAFAFSSASYSVSEETRTITVTVERLGDTSDEGEVTYLGSDGSAEQRGDVSPIIGRLVFAPGEASKSFIIFITNDSHVEGNESLRLELADQVGGALGNNGTATLTIVDNDNSETTENPIDGAQFFVRQHYRDFLNRPPDAEGLDFWSGQIASCGTDAACIADRRMNVSAAFFLSIEFQETGFLVSRLYQAAYAEPPQHLEEFLLDTRTIGQDVVVNATGWQETLAANKAALIESFVGRARFIDAYPLELTPAEFVIRLNSTSGAMLSPNEIAATIAEFADAATSEDVAARARVLRRVAESQAFTGRQLNPAFVLMQYFGYLQRNASDPPNTNLDGYHFWLHKLEEFGGDFRRAEMVKSFLVSGEYRARFGNP